MLLQLKKKILLITEKIILMSEGFMGNSIFLYMLCMVSRIKIRGISVMAKQTRNTVMRKKNKN